MVSKRKRDVWFREWIVGKQTFAQLVTKSGYSERTLKRYFYDYLEHYPTWNKYGIYSSKIMNDKGFFSHIRIPAEKSIQ